MFTDDSALEFYLDGGKTKISYIPAGELVIPEKENIINEHMWFAPVFGRTVSEYSIRSHQPNGRWQLLIDVFFKGMAMVNVMVDAAKVVLAAGAAVGIIIVAKQI